MCRKGEEPYEEFRNRKNGDKAAGSSPYVIEDADAMFRTGQTIPGHEVPHLGTSQGCGGRQSTPRMDCRTSLKDFTPAIARSEDEGNVIGGISVPQLTRRRAV